MPLIAKKQLLFSESIDLCHDAGFFGSRRLGDVLLDFKLCTPADFELVCESFEM